MGKRLGEYTESNTKCMVPVNGTKLIDRALDQLSRLGLSRVVIVVGYEGQKLIEHVGKEYQGLKIEYVVNSIYDKTNNAILVMPEFGSSTTPASPKIGSEGLSIDSYYGQGGSAGTYGWGFNSYEVYGGYMYFVESSKYGGSGYNCTIGSNGTFKEISGGSMGYKEFGGGEFTFWDEGYYLKFNKTDRTYTLTKASSLPSDAPHFVLIQYNVKQLTEVTSTTPTLKVTCSTLGYTLEKQNVGVGSLCTSEAAE